MTRDEIDTIQRIKYIAESIEIQTHWRMQPLPNRIRKVINDKASLILAYAKKLLQEEA